MRGNIHLSNTDDTFTDFMKIGKVIKNGTVTGFIDLGNGADHFNGGANGETVRDGGGSDVYKLGGGNDTYLAIKDPFAAADGTDTVDGGKGSDTYDASDASSPVTVNLDTKGFFNAPASSASGDDVGADTITNFENAVGGTGNDRLDGSNAANNLIGGAGFDSLTGLGGKDILTGGADADTFFFERRSDSGTTAATRDVITDFTPGTDHIELLGLEQTASQPLTFIGTAHFNHTAGQFRESFTGGNTIIAADINGDGKADFSIELQGHHSVQTADFVL
jgi:Ca2+-binding RTX toxin-like protein